MNESLFYSDKKNTKYDAPEIEGYSHLGNSSNEDGDSVLLKAKGFYRAHDIFIKPFFPDGDDPRHELYPYRTKWAVYGILD